MAVTRAVRRDRCGALAYGSATSGPAAGHHPREVTGVASPHRRVGATPRRSVSSWFGVVGSLNHFVPSVAWSRDAADDVSGPTGVA
jgi:hypothetical protein